MPNGHVLELVSLPVCQPRVGAALLRAHAIAAIIRLRLDPTQLPTGTMSREVTVDWVQKQGNSAPVQVQRGIGWAGIPDADRACSQYRITLNDHDLTEQAAIAVMALLIHDLEGGVLQRVLPIGSGGDYLVVTRGAKKADQVEVSGIRDDATGYQSRTRLNQKTAQVLTKSRAGFASVTTFAHSKGSIVHGYLYFVRRGSKKRRKRKRRR